MLSDKEIVTGIANHDKNALTFVYDEYYPFVENYVTQNGGSSHNAKDVFQEGMIIVYRKINAGKFSLYCKFCTYLIAVCKKIWNQELRTRYIQHIKAKEAMIAEEPEEVYAEEIMIKGKELLEKHLKKISPDCQQIIRLHINGMSLSEIKEIMGISSEHNVSDKKYRCKKKLIEKILNDPQFKKIEK